MTVPVYGYANLAGEVMNERGMSSAEQTIFVITFIINSMATIISMSCLLRLLTYDPKAEP